MAGDLKFQWAPEVDERSKIMVIGVGGAGTNAVDRMIDCGINNVELVVVNTDAAVVAKSRAPHKIIIGERATHGKGAGKDPEKGRRAMEEDSERVEKLLQGADMVLIVAGMGGGTGTGAAPVIASMAKKAGVLTVALVGKPAQYEGRPTLKRAEEGLARFDTASCDTLIIIPNDRLLTTGDPKTPISAAFLELDDLLYKASRSIVEIITTVGMVNCDFADVRATLQDAGDAFIGIGERHGPNRAVEAVADALKSGLLDNSEIKGARTLLANIVCGEDLSREEWNQMVSAINAAVGDDTDSKIGLVVDAAMQDQVRVTVIAAGLQKARAQRAILGGESMASDRLRNWQEQQPLRKAVGAEEYSTPPTRSYEEDLDIPSVLRKQGR